jgi:KUP system potassium uptake protein
VGASPLTASPSRQGIAPAGTLPVLGLAALGIVFGDIGTSPLYTFKTVLDLSGAHPNPGTIVGAASLILWTLIIITSIKYVGFAMRVDNGGEGGILALMSLLGVKTQNRPTIVAVGLFGAALIYGDGAITPAISVLSALEGLGQSAPGLTPYALPTAAGVLVLLFALQPLGSAKIGHAFGPVMLIWFVIMAVLGIFGIAQHPSIVAAVNPLHGLIYLTSGGWASFMVLGGVFLCVTGAEALYADMGHFGARPIRFAWNVIVLPSLLLNYLGQAALVLEGAPTDGNIFYRLCPSQLLMPLVVLATIATIIASQSIITGAFSMTRQAIQLGWMPRLFIKQTSSEGYGQIYVGAVNWLLMIVTLGLTLSFRKSDNLAAAYGIAVSLTMLMTSVLLYIAMREIWGWGWLAAGAVAGGFLLVDTAFFTANMAKVFEGGYVPLLLATAVYGVMWLWHRGAVAVHDCVQQTFTPLEPLLDKLQTGKISRVPGSAIFFTRSAKGAPPVMVWHLKHNRALHERVMIIRLNFTSAPRELPDHRLTVTKVAPDIWRADVRYGFMETPDIPKLLADGKAMGCTIDLTDVTYFVGHETISSRDDGEGLPRWQTAGFEFMFRNAARLSDFLRLPNDQVVEIGRQIAI